MNHTHVRVIGITLLRCGLHKKPEVRDNLKALGLRHINQTVYHKNIAPIRGMVKQVRHLVAIEPIP
ncbi:MAG: 50S ribosomal protein L30 [archaeon]|nr:50S ribosomal protein L30 [archaeon]